MVQLATTHTWKGSENTYRVPGIPARKTCPWFPVPRLTWASLCWLSVSPGAIKACLASWMSMAEPSITSRAESSMAWAASGSFVDAATPRAAWANVFRAWAVSLAATPAERSQLRVSIEFHQKLHFSSKITLETRLFFWEIWVAVFLNEVVHSLVSKPINIDITIYDMFHAPTSTASHVPRSKMPFTWEQACRWSTQNMCYFNTLIFPIAFTGAWTHKRERALRWICTGRYIYHYSLLPQQCSSHRK